MYKIERINENNYNRFEDMVYWRENGFEREPSAIHMTEKIKNELANPNLYIYAVASEGRYMGWISLIYMPKAGKWQGVGHIYVDELWVQPHYRGKGFAKALMKKADELKVKLGAAGIRLYVNVKNENALKLYQGCGFKEDGHAFFMEKR